MEEFFELTNDHHRHCAEYWDHNEMVEIPGYGEHHYLSKKPLRIHVRKQQFGDIVWVSYPQHLFISPRLHDIFQSEKVSGYEVLPADVKLVFEHEPSEAVFWQVGITGWGGIASPECGLKCVDSNSIPRLFTKVTGPGPVFDGSQWDGSDFFAIWPSPGYYVSRRVVAILEREKVRHYRVFSANMYCKQENNQVFTGRPLQCWFREERAREVGIPLGLYWKKSELGEA